MTRHYVWDAYMKFRLSINYLALACLTHLFFFSSSRIFDEIQNKKKRSIFEMHDPWVFADDALHRIEKKSEKKLKRSNKHCYFFSFHFRNLCSFFSIWKHPRFITLGFFVSFGWFPLYLKFHLIWVPVVPRSFPLIHFAYFAILF